MITYWSRGAEELYGWDRAEAVGRVGSELRKIPAVPLPLDQIKAELLRVGRWEGELVNNRRDGTPVLVASRWSLQRDRHGRPATIVVTSNDITERKRAEQALRESEEQWREVFEHNPVMYFMVSPTGTVLSVNGFGAAQLGYTAAELIGQSVLNVFFEEDRELVKEPMWQPACKNSAVRIAGRFAKSARTARRFGYARMQRRCGGRVMMRLS